MKALRLRPITVGAAIDFIAREHRRLPKIQGGLWAVCVRDIDDQVAGVALVGHPARVWMHEGVLSVLRCAVQRENPNACSMLYGACSRAARAMGATDLVTYTHLDEHGASLKASGWIDGGLTKGGEWGRDERQRGLAIDADSKRRWFAPWGKRAQAIVAARRAA